MGNRAGRDRRALESAARRAEILELRKSGLTNQAIAERFGVTEKAIRNTVKKELALANIAVGNIARDIIGQELDEIARDEARSERIIKRRLGVEQELTAEGEVRWTEDGHMVPPFLSDRDAKVVLGALDQKRKCREERAKYLQLYAPEKHEHTGKDGGPIETTTTVTADELLSRLARIAAAGGEGTGDPQPDAEGSGAAGVHMAVLGETESGRP